MKKTQMLSTLRSQGGATAVVAAISIFMLVGFTALAIDLGHLYVAKNELQNAADAGALAGARVLYDDEGASVNAGANQVAYDAATANGSEGVPVEVNWSGGNEGDVQRGHWSFGLTADMSRGFYPDPSLDPVILGGVSDEDLDKDPKFINAVFVRARREATPIASFFARIFGHENFQLSATAVAYRGFTGTLMPGEIDLPVAICEESIQDDFCNIARMLNSGKSEATHNTAAWTNFSYPCETANPSNIETCSGNDDETLTYGNGMGTTGGVQDVVLREFEDCWMNGANDLDDDGVRETPIDSADADDIPDQPWIVRLPVISCPGNNVSNCAELRSAVIVSIIWVNRDEIDIDGDAPTKMDDWDASTENMTIGVLYNNLTSGMNPEEKDAFNGEFFNIADYVADSLVKDHIGDGKIRWASFVEHFNLKNVDDQPAPFAKKSVYFLPNCEEFETAGVTGGENYGVMAKVPVLVE